MQEKVGEQGRLISPCLKAGALRHILVKTRAALLNCNKKSQLFGGAGT